MKTTGISHLALALLLATSPLALTVPVAAEEVQPQVQPGLEQTLPQPSEQPAPSDDASQSTGETTQPNIQQNSEEQGQTKQNTTAESKDSMQTEIPGQIVLQSPDAYLASSLLGSYVHAPDDSAIGEVKDLIVGTEGGLVGVVISVGGFLGIGAKDVAVEMDALTTKASPDGASVLLNLNATQEELENAPAFKTTLQQKMEEDAARSQQQMQDQLQNQLPLPMPTAPQPSQ
jgi:hypothetical protein